MIRTISFFIFISFFSFMFLNAQWIKTCGGSSDDHALKLQQTSDGGYIVAGQTYSLEHNRLDLRILKLDPNGTIEWENTYTRYVSNNILSIQQKNDGAFIVAGYEIPEYTYGYKSFWILNLDQVGNIDYQGIYRWYFESFIRSIQETSDEGYILAGYALSVGEGGEDFWVLKLASSGDVEWQWTYGGNSGDRAFFIQQTGDGGYVVAGYTRSFGAGERDIWILKLSSSGDVEWQKTYGAYFDEEASFIQPSTDGSYVIAGSTSSFGNGGEDFCILKLAQDGNIEVPCGFINESNAGVFNTDINPENTDVVAVNPELYVDMDDLFFYQEAADTTDFELCSETPLLAILTTSGGTTNPMPGTHAYESGTEINITAIPESNYRFQEWSGDALGQSNPLKITLDSDKSVKANFIRQYKLTIAAGQGGTTGPEPGTYTEDSGKEITITAIPNRGYEFSKWSGLFGTSNPIKIILNGDKSIE
ncbi:MAG: hypothetical protein OEV50_02560, partial [Candidatus Aminicenantes bacterium]|nr:hypothetical protein [Candidatus Aminicenantes bacterium]